LVSGKTNSELTEGNSTCHHKNILTIFNSQTTIGAHKKGGAAELQALPKAKLKNTIGNMFRPVIGSLSGKKELMY
jgi:hypothetical protein